MQPDPSLPPGPGLFTRIRRAVVGPPRDLRDRSLFHRLSLVAFLAWVGLGADGLSSSAYGPEECFRTLGQHTYLAIALAFVMAATVTVISIAYSRVIEHFPSGGGGYVVAGKLLGERAGVVSGSALLVDYVLTITISIAAACDALFSFLPPGWRDWKLSAEVALIVFMTLLNLRGVRESVLTLTPFFLLFLVTHAILIGGGILLHAPQIPATLETAGRGFNDGLATLGAGGMFLLFLHAYSLGGGTYTGIEAVSNGLSIMREPRVATGKRTMVYMAASLAITASGLLLCYLLWDVKFVYGKTMNAVLAENFVGGASYGPVFVILLLLSEGAILVVAAQTGFVDGPRTLAAMAADEWVPKRLKNLSERLVTQNGVLAMGLAAAAVLYYTKGAVTLLVVMYSINVFLTFTLSQIGMARHWLQVRKQVAHWPRRLAVNAVGAIVTGVILMMTVALKFREGGWVTLLATGLLVALCFAIRRHYRNVDHHLAALDDSLLNLPLPEPKVAPQLVDAGPTAIVLVESYNGLGVHTLLSIQRLFPRHFKNFVFVTVGLVDSAQFKGVDALAALEQRVRSDLAQYVQFARRLGLYADSRFAVGTDLVQELETICVDLMKVYRRPAVFAGQLVFERENLFTRTLHHGTAFSIQRRLQFVGIQVIVLPIRVWQRGPAAA